MAALRRGIAHYAEGTPNVPDTSWFKTDPTSGSFITHDGIPIPPNSPAGRAAAQAASGQPLPSYLAEAAAKGVPPPGTLRGDGYDIHRMNPDYGEAGHTPLPIDPDAPAPHGYVRTPIYDPSGTTVTGDYLQPARAPGGAQYAQLTSNTMTDAGRGLVQPPDQSTVNLHRSGDAPAPAALPVGLAPSAFGQVMAGEPAQALSNPNASPLTRWYAQKLLDTQNQERAQNLVKPPSFFEMAKEFVGGTPETFNAVMQRNKDAKALGHPLVQQDFVNNPAALAEAEKDSHAYAVKTQTPEFQKTLQNYVATHADINANGVTHTDAQGTIKKTPDDPHATANLTNKTGVTPAQADASIRPHAYTRDEFVRVMSGMPMETVKMLFGQQLGHVATPQQQITHEYISQLRADLADKAAEYNAETNPTKRQNLYNEYTKGHKYYMDQMATMAKGVQALPATGQTD